MGILADLLQRHRLIIENHLHIGYAKLDDLVARVQQNEDLGIDKEMVDEQIWTFLLGCGYAVSGPDGVKVLSEILTGEKVELQPNSKIWFEVLPIPPRKDEGNTHLDLAVGTISLRNGTQSGIQMYDAEKSWICFCEMKWNSDISTMVTYDLNRNQLVRIIENALCFQSGRGHYAGNVFVTMVTPSMFYSSKCKSRLYQYKFEEYTNNMNTILNDLHECILKKNEYQNWEYPKMLQERINCLRLNWVTYKHLYDGFLPSAISKELKVFWSKFGRL